MYLWIDADGARLREAETLTELAVHTDLAGPALATALEGYGELDGDHVWLDRNALIAAGPDRDDWREKAHAMLEGAAAHGWASPAGTHVRAHIVRANGSA